MPFPSPDPRWLPFLKIALGFFLILVMACLALAIGLGKVEQATSFGLNDLLGGFLVLSGGFAQWCFTTSKDGKDDEKEPK